MHLEGRGGCGVLKLGSCDPHCMWMVLSTFRARLISVNSRLPVSDGRLFPDSVRWVNLFPGTKPFDFEAVPLLGSGSPCWLWKYMYRCRDRGTDFTQSDARRQTLRT